MLAAKRWRSVEAQLFMCLHTFQQLSSAARCDPGPRAELGLLASVSRPLAADASVGLCPLVLAP